MHEDKITTHETINVYLAILLDCCARTYGDPGMPPNVFFIPLKKRFERAKKVKFGLWSSWVCSHRGRKEGGEKGAFVFFYLGVTR